MENYTKEELIKQLNNNIITMPYNKYLELFTEEEQTLFTEKLNTRCEITSIKRWLNSNDWKVNKIVVGEWLKSDERWKTYLQERKAKREEQDKLLSKLNEINSPFVDAIIKAFKVVEF